MGTSPDPTVSAPAARRGSIEGSRRNGTGDDEAPEDAKVPANIDCSLRFNALGISMTINLAPARPIASPDDTGLSVTFCRVAPPNY